MTNGVCVSVLFRFSGSVGGFMNRKASDTCCVDDKTSDCDFVLFIHLRIFSRSRPNVFSQN